MRHLDLFSGIGGFALATEWAWPDEEVEHIFCDNDPFSQAILRKHWPNAPIYGDIKELTAERIVADTISKRQQEVQRGPTYGSNKSHNRIDLITGGFPCQPFSSAGRRRGTEDDRHLWPEMLRLIRELRPTWVLGENVGGFITWNGGLVFEQVCTDLEEAGYEVCPLVIPAVSLNAPHRRDRVWIAAHAVGSDAGGAPRTIQGTEGETRLPERHDMAESGKSGETRNVADSTDTRLERGARKGVQRRSTRPAVKDRVDTDSLHDRLQGREREKAVGHVGQSRGSGGDERPDWSEDWPEVAATLCTMDDGLPNGLARPRGWRNAALKGAGNAIVPQVAAEILKGMRLVGNE
jgi:DNA (cytosine-5)-methyltransferase 1